jgi:colanic acid/amylovoran biosynthesis glycosyltransferase
MPQKHHQKLHLNYHGIPTGLKDINRNQKQNHPPESANTIIAAGRLVPKKGFDQLLKAFAIVMRQKPNANLIILGDGPMRKQLTALAEEMALGNHVHFFAWQEHRVTMRLIAEAEILAAPSIIAKDRDRDAIPNVILEAFALGTPVIAGNLEPITEAVQHRKTGLCVNPRDTHALASAIEELLDNSRLRQRLSQNAYEMITRRFDLRKNVEKLAKLFTEITNE